MQDSQANFGSNNGSDDQTKAQGSKQAKAGKQRGRGKGQGGGKSQGGGKGRSGGKGKGGRGGRVKGKGNRSRADSNDGYWKWHDATNSQTYSVGSGKGRHTAGARKRSVGKNDDHHDRPKSKKAKDSHPPQCEENIPASCYLPVPARQKKKVSGGSGGAGEVRGPAPNAPMKDPMSCQCMLIMHPYLLSIFALTTGWLVVQALCLEPTQFFVGGWDECCTKMAAMKPKDFWWISPESQLNSQYPIYFVAQPILRCIPQWFAMLQLLSPRLQTSLVEGTKFPSSWLKAFQESYQTAKFDRASRYIVDLLKPRKQLQPPKELPIAWLLADDTQHFSPPGLLFLFFGFVKKITSIFLKTKKWPYVDSRRVFLSLDRAPQDPYRLSTFSYPKINLVAAYCKTNLDLAKSLTQFLCLLFPWFMVPANKKDKQPMAYRSLHKPAWAQESNQNLDSLVSLLKELYALCSQTWSILRKTEQDKSNCFNGLVRLANAMRLYPQAVFASLQWTCIVVRPTANMCQDINLTLRSIDDRSPLVGTPCSLASLLFDQTSVTFEVSLTENSGRLTYRNYLYTLSCRVPEGNGNFLEVEAKSVFPMRALPIRSRNLAYSLDRPHTQRLILCSWFTHLWVCPQCPEEEQVDNCEHHDHNVKQLSALNFRKEAILNKYKACLEEQNYSAEDHAQQLNGRVDYVTKKLTKASTEQHNLSVVADSISQSYYYGLDDSVTESSQDAHKRVHESLKNLSQGAKPTDPVVSATEARSAFKDLSRSFDEAEDDHSESGETASGTTPVDQGSATTSTPGQATEGQEIFAAGNH